MWCTNWRNSGGFDWPGDAMTGAPVRPPHTSSLIGAGLTASPTFTLQGGGAAYLELPRSNLSTFATLRTTLNLTQSGTSSPNIEARILHYANGKPNARCDTDSQYLITSGTSTSASIVTTPACPNITVVLVNRDYGNTTGITVSAGLSTSLMSTYLTNGTVQIGVNDAGDLNSPGTTPSLTGSTSIGLRYIPTGADALSPGCLCEGWGAQLISGGSSVALGGANRARGGILGDAQVTSFVSDGTTATSTVVINGRLKVIQTYRISTASPNMYQDTITFTDLSGVGGTVKYRRVLDFDVEPTAFNEYMTVKVGTGDTGFVTYTDDNGFASPLPTDASTPILASGQFTDIGPTDNGALFDTQLTLPSGAGASVTMTAWFGVTASATTAASALSSVGATSWALAKPITTGNPSSGTPNTFIFGLRKG